MTLGVLMTGLRNALDTMKNPVYSVVPIHERPELFKDCCRVINAEWPASETRRLRTFKESCEAFPTCLVLIRADKVVGHCKLSLIPNECQSCFLGSVVIDNAWRSQGLGSKLLRGAEEYATKRGINKIYLSTKGQEEFYRKNGYRICEPVNLWHNVNAVYHPGTVLRSCNNKIDRKVFSGPPPPPMPISLAAAKNFGSLKSSKTYMVKDL